MIENNLVWFNIYLSKTKNLPKFQQNIRDLVEDFLV